MGGLRGSVSLSLALSNFEEGGRNPATQKNYKCADCFTAYVRFITSSLFTLHTATGNRNIVQSNCRRPGDQDFTTLYAGPHGKCSLLSLKTLPLLSTGVLKCCFKLSLNNICVVKSVFRSGSR